MSACFITIAVLAALLACLAFLGLISNPVARAGQEARLEEHLRARKDFLERRLSIRRKRRERAKELRRLFAEEPTDAPRPQGEKKGAASEEDPWLDLSGLSKRVKEHPEGAAAVVKSLIRPQLEDGYRSEGPGGIAAQ